jgi:hypothetical protein
MDLQPGFKAIVDNSGVLINWSLALFGGSVAALISTSYRQPNSWKGRLMNLVFIFAWLELGLSIREGFKISKNYIASQFGSDSETVRSTLKAMNRSFENQWLLLAYGLGCMGIWLLCFLAWFIFIDTGALKRRPVPEPIPSPPKGDGPHL